MLVSFVNSHYFIKNIRKNHTFFFTGNCLEIFNILCDAVNNKFQLFIFF